MHYAQKEKIKTLSKLRTILSAMNKPEGIDIELFIAQASVSLGMSRVTIMEYVNSLDLVGEIEYSHDSIKVIALKGETNGKSE